MRKASLFRQSGALSVLGAATLMVALLSLVLALDSGRLYLEQSKLQKVADSAALETVARMREPFCFHNDLAHIQTLAKENASLNNTSPSHISAKCVSVVDSANFGVKDTQPNPSTGRAVQTTVTATVPASLILRAGKIFGFDYGSTVSLSASAVAEPETQPMSTFTIGAELLRLNDSKLLAIILKSVGLNVRELSIMNSDGLVNASITPSGLLRALGIKVSIHELKLLSPQGIADLVEVQVGAIGIDRLVDASISLVTDSVLKADLEALRLKLLSAELLKDTKLNLFKVGDFPGLISLGSGRGSEVGAALDARINLSELLGTAILVSTGERGIQVPELNILGLVKAELGIIEPPSLQVGPMGTTAYNAQVRVYVNIDTNNLLGGILRWLTDTILGIRVHLPLYVDVTTAQAKFVSAQCTDSPPTARFEVDSTLLNACVGDIPDSLKWSTAASCEQQINDTEIIKLLHLPILSGKTHIPGLSQTETLDLSEGTHSTTAFNRLAVGNTVENIVVGLLDLLGGLFRPPALVPDGDLDYSDYAKNQLLASLAESYLENTKVNGFYNVENVTKLILEGGEELNPDTKEQLIPPLAQEDWFIPNSTPVSCALFVCPPSLWKDGTFSKAFHSYTSVPYSLLDVVGIPTLGKGFSSCAGLLSSLLNWNSCVDRNLTKLLQDKPGGLQLKDDADIADLLDPNKDRVTCSGALCVLLKPVLLILKPILNGVGELLTLIVGDLLGIELGRSELNVHELNCGAPRLVSTGE